VSQTFELQPGVEAFPGYVLHLPLGRGGCGEVWEAVGPDGKSIALKFMTCRDSHSATKEARSIQAVRRLKHPNLIRVDQVFLQPGYVVVAMELADGSVMDMLEYYQSEQSKPMPVGEVLHYFAQAAAVIDFLNAFQHNHDGRWAGYQHCDIKPSNMLVCGHTLKLADFGLSTPITAPLTPHGRSGTLEFAGPEIFQGQLSDRSDQYALAVSYCLLRGGRLPFHDTPAKFVSTYTRPQPDLSMLSHPERPVIARALAPASVMRWPSCTVLIEQLRGANEPPSKRHLATSRPR
jgi:serine/threonine-protein kinase